MKRRLDQLHAAVDATIAERNSYLADRGVTPREADQTQRAIRRVIEQASNRLIADQPEWLSTLIGYQPDDPIATQTWTGAVRDIATWRTRHHQPDHTPGLTPPSLDDPHRSDWENLNTRLIDLRVWFELHDRPQVTWPHRRSHAELLGRRDELDRIFDTAPADQHHLIHRLRRGDPQLLDDTAATLRAALDIQYERREWILEHWPHIVEYAEIAQTFDQQLWGPDTTAILASLTPTPGSALAEAIDSDEPWLRIAVGRLVSQWETTLDTDTTNYLYDLADHRQRWSITSTQPLGPTPIDPVHLAEHQRLLDWLEQPGLDPPPTSPTLDQYLDHQLATATDIATKTAIESTTPELDH